MPNYADVDYAKITTQDRNPVKRLLQSNRLDDGLKVLNTIDPDFPGTILDFGAGNGELCKRIRQRLPKAQLVCYEPVDNLRKQAAEHLKEMPNVEIVATLAQYADATFDYIFCLEVFEHLPVRQTHEALSIIQRLLKKDGKLVIGVPNEIYFAALIKGIFRMRRRYGEDDARIGNVLRASLGFPPKIRKIIEFGSVPYILRHMGFDYRAFRKTLGQYFKITQTYGSPSPVLPVFANFEVYFVCTPDKKICLQ